MTMQMVPNIDSSVSSGERNLQKFTDEILDTVIGELVRGSDVIHPKAFVRAVRAVLETVVNPFFPELNNNTNKDSRDSEYVSPLLTRIETIKKASFVDKSTQKLILETFANVEDNPSNIPEFCKYYAYLVSQIERIRKLVREYGIEELIKNQSLEQFLIEEEGNEISARGELSINRRSADILLRHGVSEMRSVDTFNIEYDFYGQRIQVPFYRVHGAEIINEWFTQLMYVAGLSSFTDKFTDIYQTSHEARMIISYFHLYLRPPFGGDPQSWAESYTQLFTRLPSSKQESMRGFLSLLVNAFAAETIFTNTEVIDGFFGHSLCSRVVDDFKEMVMSIHKSINDLES